MLQVNDIRKLQELGFKLWPMKLDRSNGKKIPYLVKPDGRTTPEWKWVITEKHYEPETLIKVISRDGMDLLAVIPSNMCVLDADDKTAYKSAKDFLETNDLFIASEKSLSNTDDNMKTHFYCRVDKPLSYKKIFKDYGWLGTGDILGEGHLLFINKNGFQLAPEFWHFAEPLRLPNIAPIKKEKPVKEPTGILIPKSQRHDALVKEAVRLRKKGSSEEQILIGLTAFSDAYCEKIPGDLIDEQELKSIAHSVMADGYEPTEEENKQLKHVFLDTVKTEIVPWLYKPYIPIGRLTMIEGDPGIGKSFVTCGLAAAVSKGKSLPYIDNVPHGIVLMLTAEDGIADTIKPRIENMGADMTKIAVIDDSVYFSSAGIEKLSLKLSELKPKLVIIDPLVAFISGTSDIHKANSVREVMAPLAELARIHECAIVCVRHLTKSTTGKAIYRGLGSIDFTAAVRSVLLVGQDSENTNKRGIVQTKNNLAPFGKPIGYSLDEGSFKWLESTDITAGAILADEPRNEDVSAFLEAIEFLKTELDEGPRRGHEVKRKARSCDISDITLRRAREEICIKPYPGRDKHWYWELKEDKTLSTKLNEQHEQHDHIDQKGTLDINKTNLIKLIIDKDTSNIEPAQKGVNERHDQLNYNDTKDSLGIKINEVAHVDREKCISNINTLEQHSTKVLVRALNKYGQPVY